MKHTTVKRIETSLTEFQGMATVAPQMLAFFETLKRVARTDATVLIRGESGVGKELVAKAIHALSPRSKRAFRAINCATLTGELLASELFGHVRGAFTGAVGDRRGLLSLADRGTVFLDEVAEVPLELQARLLRVLQEKTFVPVGGHEELKVDIRVVSATNKALRELVDKGTFREDLMYRIRVVTLFVPRLAEREGDVEALAWRFVDEFNALGYRHVDRMEAAALDAMKSYAWPGNVRELRNNIEHAFAVGEGNVLRRVELSPDLQGASSRREQPARSERDQIVEALRSSNHRRDAAARSLGMSRTTLWRKMREMGLSEKG